MKFLRHFSKNQKISRSKRSGPAVSSAASCAISHGCTNNSSTSSNHYQQRPDDLPNRSRTDTEFWQSNAANHPAADADRATVYSTICQHHHTVRSHTTGAAGEFTDDAAVSADSTNDAGAADEGTGTTASGEPANHNHQRARPTNDDHAAANEIEPEHLSNTEHVADPTYPGHRKCSSNFSKCAEWEFHATANADDSTTAAAIANHTNASNLNGASCTINASGGDITTNTNTNHHDNETGYAPGTSTNKVDRETGSHSAGSGHHPIFSSTNTR